MICAAMAKMNRYGIGRIVMSSANNSWPYARRTICC